MSLIPIIREAHTMSRTDERLRKLLASGEYSDLTLVCRGQEFRVHKMIVCTQSPMIDAALKGDFMEARTNMMEVDFDPEVLKCMLEYMYTAGYETKPASTKENKQEGQSQKTTIKLPKNAVCSTTTDTDLLLYHLSVNSIADYYGVKDLAVLSASRVYCLFRNAWSADVFLDFVEKAESQSGDRSLHDGLAQLAARHAQELIRKDCFARGKVANNMAAEVLKVVIKLLDDREDEVRGLKGELRGASTVTPRRSIFGERLSFN